MTSNPEASRQQMRMVLAALPAIEKRSRFLPVGEPISLEVSDREAFNPNSTLPAWPIPDGCACPNPGTGSRAKESTTSAALVRMSKFSTPSSVRANALYWDSTPAVSVRLVIDQTRQRSRFRSAIRARRVLGGSTMLQAPTVLDHGRSRRFEFLIEHLVFGDHPRSVSEKLEAGRKVIDRLVATHATIGVKHRVPLAHPETEERIRALFDQLTPFEEWPEVDELIDLAKKLVKTRRTIPTGWIHGDIVFSNLISDPYGDLHLIDWEHAAVRPVVADLAKIAAAMPGADGLAQILEEGAGSALEAPSGGLSIRDQLTRFYLQEISWWEPKYRRAIEVQRLKTFDSWAHRRMELLGLLME